MTRPRDYYRNPDFESGAAPEAIAYRLDLERRTAEREAGTWPGTPDTTEGTNP